MLGLMITSPRSQKVTPGGEFGWSDYGGAKTKSGVTVTEEIALTNPSVLSATRMIAEDIGGLPLQQFKRVSQNEREQITSVVADLVQRAPNPLMTATPFWEGRISHQVNWDGGGFAEIEFDPRTNAIKYLWPVHPSRVRRPERGSEFDYLVRGDDGKDMPLYADEMLHIPGVIASDGIWSCGLINYGRETVGGCIGVDRANAAHLASGGQPKGILKASGLQDRDKRDAFRKEWERVHGNPAENVPTIAIIGQDMAYTAMQASSGEANQIVQTRALNKSDIATLYRLPAYKLPGAEGKDTAGTVEQKAIEYVIALLPWARKIEEQCGLKLLTRAQQIDHYFEHNFTALLRGDTAARYNAYRIAFSIGIMTINEIRRLENLPNIGPAGDQHFVPANMTTAQRALEGDMGNGGAMGSDHNGQPADNPMDRQASQLDMDRQNAEWLKSLGTIQGNEAKQQLKLLEHALPERPVDYREGARVALLDVFGRVLSKESLAATAALKGKGDFEAWMREFYAKQEAMNATSLESACWALRAAGVSKWGQPAELAAWLKARSTEALTRSYNSDTPEAAGRRLRAWPTDRARELADEILGAS